MSNMEGNAFHFASAVVLAAFVGLSAKANAFDPVAYAAALESEFSAELRDFEREQREEVSQAVGMAFAVAAMPQAERGSMISVGGSYQSMAVGYSFSDSKHSFKVHAAGNKLGEYLGAVGYGFKF